MESKIDYEVSDEQLVFMINENSEDAKDALYEKYSAMIHKELNAVKRSAYALGIEWQDLFQEAMLGFSTGVSTYNGEHDAKFSTYATMCVRRRLLNIIEKNSTAKKFASVKAIPLDNLNDRESGKLFIKEIPGKEPLNKVIIEEDLTQVKINLNDKLSDDERAIIDYATDGMKPEEIAKIFGKTPKQVYNILYRARKKIKP